MPSRHQHGIEVIRGRSARSISPLRQWRTRCGFASWDEAGEALGIHRRTLYRYMDAKAFPRYLALALAAVEAGLEPIAPAN
jgi:hypothetical protein